MAEAQRRHEGELARDLRDMAIAWREATMMREFLDRVEPSLLELDAVDGGGRGRWIEWARGHVGRQDPAQNPAGIAKRLTIGTG